MSIYKYAFFISLLFPLNTYAVNCPKDTTIYDSIVFQASEKYKVDPALVHAVIKQESCYDFKAVSRVGAEGLMQLMPATADRFNVDNSFDPRQNINAGTKYLAWLLKRFKGRVDYALAGYNAGEGRVDQYNGIPPFKETKAYVSKVMSNYYSFKGIKKTKKKPLIKLVKKPIKKAVPTGLEAKKIYITGNEKLPTGLDFNKQKIAKTKIKKKINNKKHVSNFNAKRKIIRSVTVAMNSIEGRKGYVMIKARKSGAL